MKSRLSTPKGCKHVSSLSLSLSLPSLYFIRSFILTDADFASVGGLWFRKGTRFGTLWGRKIHKSVEVEIRNKNIYGDDMRPIPCKLLDSRMVITHTGLTVCPRSTLRLLTLCSSYVHYTSATRVQSCSIVIYFLVRISESSK